MDPAKAPPEMAALLGALGGADLGGGGLGGLGGDAPFAGGTVSRPDGDSEEIRPEPAFVFKTHDDTGRKVFINVLGSESIGAPGGWERGRVPEHVEEALARQDAEPSESLRFPLSLSDPVNDLDKKGEPCTVFDCALNGDVVKQAMAPQNNRLKVFLVELAMGWVASKHDLMLNPKFKLPRMKYKGANVQSHRIRVDPKSVVQEIKDVEDVEAIEFPLVTKPRPATVKNAPKAARGKGPGAAAAAAGGPGAAPSPFRFAGKLEPAVEYVGRPVTAARVTVRGLPEGAGAGAVAVEALVDRVRVAVEGVPEALEVPLPFAVTGEGAAARLAGAGTLVVEVPLWPLEDVVREMRKAAPHRFGALDFANSSFLELE